MVLTGTERSWAWFGLAGDCFHTEHDRPKRLGDLLPLDRHFLTIQCDLLRVLSSIFKFIMTYFLANRNTPSSGLMQLPSHQPHRAMTTRSLQHCHGTDVSYYFFSYKPPFTASAGGYFLQRPILSLLLFTLPPSLLTVYLVLCLSTIESKLRWLALERLPALRA